MTICECYEGEYNIVKFTTYNNMLKMCCYHYYLHLTENNCQPPLEVRLHYLLDYKNIVSYIHNGKILLLNKRDTFTKDTKCVFTPELKIKFKNIILNENEYEDLKKNRDICFEKLVETTEELLNVKSKLSSKENEKRICFDKLLKISEELNTIKSNLLNKENETNDLKKILESFKYKLSESNKKLDKVNCEFIMLENINENINNKLEEHSKVNKRLVNLLTIYKYHEFNNVEKYNYNSIKEKNKKLNSEFKRVAKLMKLC